MRSSEDFLSHFPFKKLPDFLIIDQRYGLFQPIPENPPGFSGIDLRIKDFLCIF